MLRLLKALPLAFAIASLSLFAGCGSSSQSQVRVVHAISDAPALDVDVNTTKAFTNLAFTNFQPTTGYTKVTSGNVTLEAVDTGTSTAVIANTNTAPTSGNVEFRIINGSSNSPVGGFDVYIVPPGTNIGNVTPQISGLTLGQGSGYVSLTFAANGYEVFATPHGNTFEDVNQIYATPTGSIRTLVIVDNQGGGGISQLPIELNDLN